MRGAGERTEIHDSPMIPQRVSRWQHEKIAVKQNSYTDAPNGLEKERYAKN